MTGPMRVIVRERPLWLSVLGLGWVAAFVVVLLGSVAGRGSLPLHGTAAGLGAAIGYALERWLARGHNELGLIPFGSIGMSVVPASLGVVWLIGADNACLVSGLVCNEWFGWGGCAVTGAFLAWFSFPLYRFLRDRPGAPDRSARRAGALLSAAVFGSVAIGVFLGLRSAGLDPAHVLVVLALMNAAVALFIYRLLPEFLLRFLAWLLVHGLYRLERHGLEHVPEAGPAVVACNHVSYADAIVIMAACTRPIRFVMDHRIFRVPILSFVFRHSRAIPIAPAREDPALLEAAYEEVARALEAGELVGIFPEGAITRTGEVETFRGGIVRIVGRTPVEVVPMGLSGLWGSVFSRRFQGWLRYLPKGVLPRITLRASRPLTPAELDPEALREVVVRLRGLTR